MTSLLARSLRRGISTVDDYIQAVSFAGNRYTFLPSVQQTITGDRIERPGDDLAGFGRRMYVENGIVFALIAIRSMLFSSVRIAYQRLDQGRPAGIFGNRDLRILEEPWPGGTTQELLGGMIDDADTTGNAYVVRDRDIAREEPELVMLEPTWLQIVLDKRPSGFGHRKIGFLYYEGGIGQTTEPVFLDVREVAHFMPRRDPFEPWKGMSWLRTVFTEIGNDRLMERYKTRTFEQGATPNMVVKTGPEIGEDGFDEFVEGFQAAYSGPQNAGKTMILSPGVDVEVVGRDLGQLRFKEVQGHAETRIAAAAGIPPVIVGFSEGLAGSSLNAGNYGSARRRLADVTMHPLWQSGAGALRSLVPRAPGARLWYDTRDVPFIREDESDVAAIQQTRASTIRTLLDSGFDPNAAVRFVSDDDEERLTNQHSGLFSVQLQPPGTTQEPAGESAEPSEQPTGEADD